MIDKRRKRERDFGTGQVFCGESEKSKQQTISFCGMEWKIEFLCRGFFPLNDAGLFDRKKKEDNFLRSTY